MSVPLHRRIIGINSYFCMVQLPPELWDAIIGHLGDDRHALGACGAVCKGWLPASRFALFGGGAADDVYASQTFLETTFIMRSIVHQFVALLDSPNCTLAPALRYLRLWNKDPWMNRYMHKFTAFSNLQRLDLDRTYLDGLSPEAWSVLTCHFPNTVRILRLEYIGCASLQKLVELVASYRLLEVLCVARTIECPHGSLGTFQLPHNATEFRPSLRTLDLPSEESSIAILNWISSKPAPSVTNFRIYVPEQESYVDSICSFIKLLGLSLERLVLSGGFMLFAVRLAHRLDLSLNTNLRVLDLGDVILVDHVSHDYIPIVLSRICSHCIEEISFGLYQLNENGDIRSNIDLEWHGARATADILAQPQLSNLRALVVRLSYVRSSLRECDARGILKIVSMAHASSSWRD
ncbi:hypothetical protein PLICRDRAFT_651517 [Plicaturopsis crispa FD-325 SS-3]|nr:hypothetical protein PLICRDRAFT_651517 [Plicaturopsis crispa FD-325 SS-3]